MLRVKPTLVASTGVLVEHVREAQIVEKAGRGKTKENLPISGRPDLTRNPNGFGQIGTANRTKLQPMTATLVSFLTLVKRFS